jgi:hypothetical protein
MSLSTHLADIYLEELEKVLALPEVSEVSHLVLLVVVDHSNEIAQMPPCPPLTTLCNFIMPYPNPNSPFQTPRLGLQTHNLRPHYRLGTKSTKYILPKYSGWMLCR